MAEFDDKLNSLLSNPEAMDQIMKMAQSLMGGEGQTSGGTQPPNTPPLQQPYQAAPQQPSPEQNTLPEHGSAPQSGGPPPPENFFSAAPGQNPGQNSGNGRLGCAAQRGPAPRWAGPQLSFRPWEHRPENHCFPFADSPRVRRQTGIATPAACCSPCGLI